MTQPTTLRLTTGGGRWRPVLRAMERSAQRQRAVQARLIPQLHAEWRWAAWAERLAGRHAAGNLVWDRLATILRHMAPRSSPAPRATVAIRQEVYLSAPRSLHLTLHLVTAAARQAVEPRQVAPTPASTSWRTATRQVQVEAARSPSASLTQVGGEEIVMRLRHREIRMTWRESQLVERILARRERRDNGASPAPTWADTPPVPRVFHQPAAAPGAATPEPSVHPVSPVHDPRYWEDSRPPPAPAAADVERLTEQVIRALDQRVVAARERLGKR